MKIATLLRSLCIGLAVCALVVAQAKDGDKGKTGEKDKEKAGKDEKPKEPTFKVGDKAPAIKADEILHPKVKSLSEVKGRLILYEYFAYW